MHLFFAKLSVFCPCFLHYDYFYEKVGDDLTNALQKKAVFVSHILFVGNKIRKDAHINWLFITILLF